MSNKYRSEETNFDNKKLLDTKRCLSNKESRLFKERGSQKLSDDSSALDIDLLYNRCHELETFKAKRRGKIEKIANDCNNLIDDQHSSLFEMYMSLCSQTDIQSVNFEILSSRFKFSLVRFLNYYNTYIYYNKSIKLIKNSEN